MNKIYYLAWNGYLSKEWALSFASLDMAKDKAKETKERTGEQQTIFVKNEWQQYIIIERV